MDKKGLRYLTQLRLDLNPLNNYKFEHHFLDTNDAMCNSNDGIEDAEHFLLNCHDFTRIRNTLMSNVSQKINVDFHSFINSNYNGPDIRTGKQFYQPKVKTTFKGQESLTYFAPKIWNMVPEEYKSLSSLDKFKNEIKTWKPSECPCRLCKNYIPGVGYMNVFHDSSA